MIFMLVESVIIASVLTRYYKQYPRLHLLQVTTKTQTQKANIQG